MSNSTGTLLRLTTFGESHGKAVGGIIDGMPSGIEVDYALLRADLLRRRTAQQLHASSRNEPDEVQFLSGIFQHRTLGTPICFVVENKDQHAEDYAATANIFRPSHADYTYAVKYAHCDFRGGGRASARTTVADVVGGAFAKMLLKKYNINIQAYTSQIGKESLNTTPDWTYQSALECPDAATTDRMQTLLNAIRTEGDTIGGVSTCCIENLPAGLGEPIYNKVQASLAAAMMSIPAAKGFEYGEGFAAATMKGSEHNDPFGIDGKPTTNHAGGLLGGITTGLHITFRVAFKPISSIAQPQHTADTNGQLQTLTIKGRHDVCVLPRVNVVVEAKAAMVIADYLLMHTAYHHNQ
ncbi:MAG: chorismate synthase [Bacteroidales bacterium]|nr:chorismate synthase [Bacteroidales bacterium]